MPQIALPSAPPLSNPPLSNYSQAVPTASTMIVPLTTTGRRYLQLVNIGSAAGPTLWFSWNAPATVGGVGSIPLGPYGNSAGHPSVFELGLNGGVVFTGALYGISDSTSATPVDVTCYVA